jgi:hypothetical protein
VFVGVTISGPRHRDVFGHDGVPLAAELLG